MANDSHQGASTFCPYGSDVIVMFSVYHRIILVLCYGTKLRNDEGSKFQMTGPDKVKHQGMKDVLVRGTNRLCVCNMPELEIICSTVYALMTALKRAMYYLYVHWLMSC